MYAIQILSFLLWCLFVVSNASKCTFKSSSYECVKLMKREAEAPDVYKDIIREVSAPKNSYRQCTSSNWFKMVFYQSALLRKIRPFYPSSSASKLRRKLWRILQTRPPTFFQENSTVPLSYWSYASGFLDKVRRF